jgi:hypothetical protein
MFMNSVVALPIVAALPVAAPAMDFPLAPITPPPAADLELVDLANQLVAAEAEFCRLNQIVDQMDGVRFAVTPPDNLKVRASDAGLGIPKPDESSERHRPNGFEFYDACEVEKLRKSKWTDEERSGKIDHDDGFTVTVRYKQPSPEARARADEIIAAYDKWLKSTDRKPRGYRAARRAYNNAEKRARELESQIHEIRATTVTGMIAKARCAQVYDFHLGAHAGFCIEIAEDLLALNVSATPIAATDVALVAKSSPAVRTAAIEAIDRYRRAHRLFDDGCYQLNEAEEAAWPIHGHRPIALVAWRNYSAISDSEIENARDEFLRIGMDPDVIETEYREAKRRERAILKAGRDWDKKVGIVAIRKQLAEARRELHAAQKAMRSVKLISIADAAAVMEVVRANLKQFGEITDWETAALSNATKFLNRATGAVA